MAKTTPPLRLTHRLWRMLPAGPRRRALASATAMVAPRPERVPAAPRLGLIVAGELSRPSGLGESARLMLSALAGMGVAATPIDLGDPASPRRGGARPRPRMAIPAAGMPLVMHVNAPLMPLALLRMPRRMIHGRRVIGYWAWELPTMPQAWRLGLQFVHEVWVLSAFTAAAVTTMLPPGSSIKVVAVPPPLAITPPVPSRLGRAEFGLPDNAVITLVSFSLASSFARKNPLAAIAAHRAAFANRPDRILLVKVTHAELFPHDYAVLRAAARGMDNIRFEIRSFSPGDRHALTACADIVLSLHRSEGLGLVPAEAMLLGVPVVATGWSATTEFMDASSARMVAFRLIPAVDPRGVFQAPGAVWADADIDDAADHLRTLALDPALRQSLGQAGRRMAAEKLGDARLRQAVRALGLPFA